MAEEQQFWQNYHSKVGKTLILGTRAELMQQQQLKQRITLMDCYEGCLLTQNETFSDMLF